MDAKPKPHTCAPDRKPATCLRCHWCMVERRPALVKTWVRCLHVLKTYELIAEISGRVGKVAPPDWCPLEYGERAAPTLETVADEMAALAWWRAG